MFFKKKEKMNDFLNENSHTNQSVSIQLTDVEIKQQLDFIRLSEDELRVLKSLQPIVSDHLESLVAAFYDAVLKVESLKKIIETHSSVLLLISYSHTHH
jgi:heam-based aerotactic trancducer